MIWQGFWPRVTSWVAIVYLMIRKSQFFAPVNKDRHAPDHQPDPSDVWLLPYQGSWVCEIWWFVSNRPSNKRGFWDRMQEDPFLLGWSFFRGFVKFVLGGGTELLLIMMSRKRRRKSFFNNFWDISFVLWVFEALKYTIVLWYAVIKAAYCLSELLLLYTLTCMAMLSYYLLLLMNVSGKTHSVI